MKVQMMNNKLIYDLEDSSKQYRPNDQGVWSGPVLLEDINTYLRCGQESIVLRKWPRERDIQEEEENRKIIEWLERDDPEETLGDALNRRG